MDLPTILTVTYNTWETFTSRLVSSFFQYVDPFAYKEWLVVDNASKDGEKISRAMKVFPLPHNFTLIHSDVNIRDLPQYSRIINQFVRTEKVICISTDIRLFPHSIQLISTLLDYYDMVGIPGPYMLKGMHTEETGGGWHWVPKLLEDRNLDFDNTAHIQTHCFGIRRSAFLDVGGFWESPDNEFGDKGDLIAAEVYLGYKLRTKGYKLGFCSLPIYHYGNAAKSQDELDEFDRKRGWAVDFPRIL